MMVNFRNLATALLALAAPLGAAAAPVNDDLADWDAAVLESIKDKYIVTFKTGLEKRDIDTHVAWVNGVQRRNLSGRNLTGVEQSFDFGDFHAYAGHFDEDTIKEIEDDPAVMVVERDAIVKTDAFVVQNNAPYGLATLSSVRPGGTTYRYDDTAGRDRTAYVLDSGIRASHVEFGGRVRKGYNALNAPFDDFGGHGTAVAGVIGGRVHGVAKAINLVDVKVFHGRIGTTAAVLEGLVWAAWDARNEGIIGKCVINMSMSTQAPVVALDEAVNHVYNAGILVVVAAGNDAQDASQSSPARAAKAFTVGAIDQNWREAQFSNFGASVTIMAPGVNIVSASRSSDTALGTDSGTSFAAPYVAGVAMYISRLFNVQSHRELEFWMLFNQAKGVGNRKIGSPDGIINNLAH